MEKSNEQLLVEKVINFDNKFIKAIEYVKENYHVQVDYYDEENGELHLSPIDINEGNVGTNLVNAREYVNSHVDNDMCTPVID